MIHPIACVALIFSAAIPIEQPTASAENWQPVLHGDFCVDYNSEKIDGDWITWSYNKCAAAPAARLAKVNCRNWGDKNAAQTLYEFDKASGEWRAESLDPTSQQDDLVMVECVGSWMVGGRSSVPPK